MKRKLIRSLAMMLMITLLCSTVVTASASEKLYHISELKTATTLSWQQTYQAYGRTIEVNEQIVIPDVDAAPVLTVRLMPPISGAQYSELSNMYAQSAKNDPDRLYEFASSELSTATIWAWPRLWDEKKGYKVGAIGQHTHAIFDYNLNEAYADVNPLTLGDALDIAQSNASEIYPGLQLYLRNVALYDRTYWKSNNEPISEKGNYFLELSQVFHGIPLMASIHHAFIGGWVENESWWLSVQGLVSAEIFDSASYGIGYSLYEETGVQYDDIALIPFDVVKPKVEELILNGYVRFIDSITLGYVQYDTANKDEMVLMPAWVVWCEYDKQGPRHESTSPLYTQSIFVHNDRFQALIFNAQTGEMIDPGNVTPGRCLCPTIITK